jgi:hypothetical protein
MTRSKGLDVPCGPGVRRSSRGGAQRGAGSGRACCNACFRPGRGIGLGGGECKCVRVRLEVQLRTAQFRCIFNTHCDHNVTQGFGQNYEQSPTREISRLRLDAYGAICRTDEVVSPVGGGVFRRLIVRALLHAGWAERKASTAVRVASVYRAPPSPGGRGAEHGVLWWRLHSFGSAGSDASRWSRQ